MSEPIKAGDRLAMYGCMGEISVVTVDRVTASGRIIVGGHTLNPNLSIRGRDPWSRIMFRRLTNEIWLEYNRQQRIRKLSKTDWSKVSCGALRAICEILHEEPSDQG